MQEVSTGLESNIKNSFCQVTVNLRCTIDASKETHPSIKQFFCKWSEYITISFALLLWRPLCECIPRHSFGGIIKLAGHPWWSLAGDHVTNAMQSSEFRYKKETTIWIAAECLQGSCGTCITGRVSSCSHSLSIFGEKKLNLGDLRLKRLKRLNLQCILRWKQFLLPKHQGCKGNVHQLDLQEGGVCPGAIGRILIQKKVLNAFSPHKTKR